MNEKANSLREEARAVKETLQKDMASLRRGTKCIIIVGIVVVLLVGVYFNWIYRELSGYLEPEELAAMVRGNVSQNLPVVAKNLEGSLKEAAPKLADDAEAKLLESIPLIRIQLEAQGMKLIDAIAVELNEKIHSSIDKLIEEHGKDVEEMLPELTDEVIVQEFVKDLKAGLLEGADQILKEKTGESLDVKCEKSLLMLKDINEELLHLLKSERLTSDEILEKQILEIVIAIVRGMPDFK